MYLHERIRALIEGAHKPHLIAYGTTWADGHGWRLTVIRDNETGHYPISADYWTGTESEAHAEADRLNRLLNLPARTVMTLISGSMQRITDRRTA